ncbi:MAG: c-type cytochrome [Balneolaceae bacterium]|nr:c-type cytochrome [Balneolaceae bacterium]
MDFRKLVIPIALILVWCAEPIGVAAQDTGWTAPEKADKLENPLEPSDRIRAAGDKIFQQLCAVCHGKNGEGDGVTASSLEPKPANLKNSTIQNQSDGALFWKIREGRPPMPPFGSQLSEKQMWAVVTYIKSLD